MWTFFIFVLTVLAVLPVESAIKANGTKPAPALVKPIKNTKLQKSDIRDVKTENSSLSSSKKSDDSTTPVLSSRSFYDPEDEPYINDISSYNNTNNLSARSGSFSPQNVPAEKTLFDMPISPLGGYKKYEKAYISLPGYSAGKEKSEGGGLMPAVFPVGGMVPIPYGGLGGFGNAAPPPFYQDFSGAGYGNGFAGQYSPYGMMGPNIANNGPYMGNNGPMLSSGPFNPMQAGPAVLSNNRPSGPRGYGARPLPPHCTCTKLADCRDVSRFGRMDYGDDYGPGQCLPSFVVCCNPEILEQQKIAAHPLPPPPPKVVPVMVPQPGPIIPIASSIPAVVPLIKTPGGVPPPPGAYGGGAMGPVMQPPACGLKGKNPMARVLDEGPRDDAEFGEYPWMAAVLLADMTYTCGGALLDNRFVLTAAHCVSKHKNKNLIVRLGEYDVVETSEPPYQDLKVVDVIIHAGYHSGTLRNDVALLVLEAPAMFTSYISPVCLPTGPEMYPEVCSVTGWGKDDIHHGKWSSRLKAVHLPLVTNEFCENSYRKSPQLGKYFNLDDSFICAGAPGKDACYGDGGSPMVCGKDGVYQLVGLVSWGIDCGQYPGVYARVHKFVPWILDVMKQYH